MICSCLGGRVEVKTAMQQSDGTWKFRLHRTRRSFHGRYRYVKDYAQDCDVVVLVCVFGDGREPVLYLLPGRDVPGTVRVRAGATFEGAREAWELLPVDVLSLAA